MPLPTAAELTDPNATNTQMKQRLGQLAENVESKEDSTEKANAAQAAAITAAKADATTKANAAEANAKNYTDSKTSNISQNLENDIHQFVDNEFSIVARIDEEAQLHLVGLDNSVQDEFIAAATDATTKANAAEANAKNYTDSKTSNISQNLENDIHQFVD
ncbi:hypothetical protein KTI62_13645, partial [Acinetobacter schindleri]|uniref:hypothetical protein n=1 Tax=Acinetobacter schindleri TaxID=108981 RepID=UPI0021CD724E